METASHLAVFVTLSDPPQLFNGQSTLSFYSILHAAITLNVTMRALPDIIQPVHWTLPNMTILQINTTNLGSEVFQSLLHIDLVQPEDYGTYIVKANNEIGSPSSLRFMLISNGTVLFFCYFHTKYFCN